MCLSIRRTPAENVEYKMMTFYIKPGYNPYHNASGMCFCGNVPRNLWEKKFLKFLTLCVSDVLRTLNVENNTETVKKIKRLFRWEVTFQNQIEICLNVVVQDDRWFIERGRERESTRTLHDDKLTFC